MGMEHKIVTADANSALWEKLSTLLAEHRFPIQLRMLDGQLAFPNEVPPPDWRELRVGTSQGMVTLRRDADGVALVTWGNADAAMRQAWNALTWACARVTGGQIQTDVGLLTAEVFQQTAELPVGGKG
jgi:hypothetical protein